MTEQQPSSNNGGAINNEGFNTKNSGLDNHMNKSMDLTTMSLPNGSKTQRPSFHSPGDMMGATFNTTTGLAPPSGAYLAMLEAKNEREQKRQQMQRMEARLHKLQVDEDKMNKRIQDARKQQEFVINMKLEKQRQIDTKMQYQMYVKQQEEQNRRRFLQERQQAKQQIHQNLQKRFVQNHNAGDEIKHQRQRIAQSIGEYKNQNLEEKKRNFALHKDHIIQLTSLRHTSKGSFFDQTTQQYKSKVDQTRQEAIEFEEKMRDLEQKELQMVMRLQNTQRMQQAEQQKLKAMRTSPGRSPHMSTRDIHSVTEGVTVFDGPKHKPLVLCGPSGAGKSTFTAFIMSEASPYKNFFAFSVSSTTRQPRAGEKDGIHYHFTTKEDFQAEVERGNFLEHNEVHGNYYGTHKSAVREIMAQGKICILDIDVKGAMDIAKKASKEFQCNFVFVQTNTIDDLRQRLKARGTETEESLAKRVSNAEKEMNTAKESGLFQKTLINDEKERFIKEATQFVVNNLYNLKV